MKWITQRAGTGCDGVDHWIIISDDYNEEYTDDVGDHLFFPTKQEAQQYIEEVIA